MLMICVTVTVNVFIICATIMSVARIRSGR